MNKGLKRLITLGLLSINLITPIVGNAESTNIINKNLNEISSYDDFKGEDNYVLISKQMSNSYIILDKSTGEQITDVKETVNGVARSLSADEALEKLNQSFDETEGVTPPKEMDEKNTRATEYFFRRTSGPTQYTGASLKMSPDVEARYANTIISTSQTWSSSVNVIFGVTLQAERDAITANSGLQASWAKSATAKITVGHTVPKGKIGYVGFKPYKYRVKGTLTAINAQGNVTSSKSIESTSPKKLASGFCDGLSHVVIVGDVKY